MSIGDKILFLLSNNPCAYKKLRNKLIGNVYSKDKLVKEQTLKRSLSRLRDKGIIDLKNKNWKITPEGIELFKLKNKGLRRFLSEKSLSKKVVKEVLVLFDIPEKERYKRDWLRRELVTFGYEQIQRSVWFGPKLPKDFITYLTQENIYLYIHIFKVSKNLFD